MDDILAGLYRIAHRADKRSSRRRKPLPNIIVQTDPPTIHGPNGLLVFSVSTGSWYYRDQGRWVCATTRSHSAVLSETSRLLIPMPGGGKLIGLEYTLVCDDPPESLEVTSDIQTLATIPAPTSGQFEGVLQLSVEDKFLCCALSGAGAARLVVVVSVQHAA